MRPSTKTGSGVISWTGTRLSITSNARRHLSFTGTLPRMHQNTCMLSPLLTFLYSRANTPSDGVGTRRTNSQSFSSRTIVAFAARLGYGFIVMRDDAPLL